MVASGRRKRNRKNGKRYFSVLGGVIVFVATTLVIYYVFPPQRASRTLIRMGSGPQLLSFAPVTKAIKTVIDKEFDVEIVDSSGAEDNL